MRDHSLFGSLLILLCAGLLSAPVAAQVAVRPPVYSRAQAPAHDLAVRLEAEQIWRHKIQLRSVASDSANQVPESLLEFELRFRCVAVHDDRYVVEADFIDWLLQVESGEQRTEWHAGRFRQNGSREESAKQSTACRDLLAAWSEGLRLSALRFEMTRDGRVHGLTGFESLREGVAAVLAGECQPTESLQVFFGEEGLDRFEAAIELVLGVGRPLQETAVGATWSSDRELRGLDVEPVRLRRSYRFAGTERERRHHLAVLDLRPTVHWLEASTWSDELRSTENPAERANLRLLLDSGLVYSLDLRLDELLPQRAGRVGVRLTAHLEE